MTDKKAQLTIDGIDKTIELPIYASTIGPDVIDVTGITKNGFFTFDPGFMSTASCESKITFIDGDEGVLLHRGYPIEQLAVSSDYLETCYLLLNGELPTQAQKEEFTAEIKKHSAVDASVARSLNRLNANRILWLFCAALLPHSPPFTTMKSILPMPRAAN